MLSAPRSFAKYPLPRVFNAARGRMKHNKRNNESGKQKLKSYQKKRKSKRDDAEPMNQEKRKKKALDFVQANGKFCRAGKICFNPKRYTSDP
jgi:hypothetical protein